MSKLLQQKETDRKRTKTYKSKRHLYIKERNAEIITAKTMGDHTGGGEWGGGGGTKKVNITLD